MVLSGEQIDRFWQLDQGLLGRVRLFYGMVFNDVFGKIPRDVSDDDPKDIRLLSALRRFKEDHVAWGETDELGGGRVQLRFTHNGVIRNIISILPMSIEPDSTKSVLYSIQTYEQGNLLMIFPVPTTQRFASISLAGGLASLAGQELQLQKEVKKDLIVPDAEIAFVEHLTNYQYLKKIEEMLDAEGITDLNYGRIPNEQYSRMLEGLDAFLFPDMPPLSSVEANARESLSRISFAYQVDARAKE